MKRDEYLNSVCQEVRFKAARKYLKAELSTHIDDKAAELEQSGVADAESEAIKAMGDPVQTGRALNAVHKPRVEWGVIVCVLLLTVAGITLSVMSMYAMDIDVSYIAGTYYFEWIMLAVSLTSMVLLIFADYRRLGRLRYACFGMGLTFIAAYLVFTFLYPHLDFTATGLTSASPVSADYGVILTALKLKKIVSAVSSVLFLFGTTGFLNRHRHWRNTDLALLLGCLIATVCAVSIVSFQFALLTVMTELVMMLVSLTHNTLRKTKKWRFALISIAAAAGPLALYMLLLPQPETAGRDVLSMMFPGAATDSAFQQFIQPSITDNTATAAFKAYGWLFSLVGSLIFLLMLVLLVRRSLNVTDSLGRTLTLGISTFFIMRCLLGILSVLGVTGPLAAGIPFISDGPASFLLDALLIGMFLSVWRRSSFMHYREAENLMTA